MAVVVKGLREFQRVMAAAGPEARKELRSTLREVAEPVRVDAETFARTGIRKVGPRWSRMRVGVTQKLVYVAPRERGIKRRGPDPRRRPKFGDLLERRAMDPAAAKNEREAQRRVEDAFDGLARKWSRS